MALLDKLEQSLVDPLDKKAPYKMSPGARKGLAKALWIISLVLGILQLWATWGLWSLGHYVNRAQELTNEYYNSISAYYDMPVVETTQLGFFYYLSLAFMLVSALLLLFAAPKLKAFSKQGWNLLFYSLLVSVLYSVFRMFAEVGGGFFQLLFGLIVTAVVAYFLFQVRDQFSHKGAAHAEHHDKKE